VLTILNCPTDGANSINQRRQGPRKNYSKIKNETSKDLANSSIAA
jgi:hypothetical protein